MNDIVSVCSALGRRWKTLALTLVIAIAAGAAMIALTPNEYRSTATLAVSVNDSNAGVNAYQGGMAAGKKVETYALLGSESDLPQRVEQASSGKVKAEDVRKSVKVSNPKDTVLLKIDARNSDPQFAARMAQYTATSLTDLIKEIEDHGNGENNAVTVTQVGRPEPSSNPVGLKPWEVLAIAALLGLIIGAALAVIRDRLDTKVNSAADIAKACEHPVLGELYDDARKKGGKKESSPQDAHLGTSYRNAEALRQLRTNIGFIDVDKHPRVFQFTSAVADEGKSYVASRAARVMAEAGHKVLLIDADLRKPDQAQAFGIAEDIGLTSVLSTELDPEDAIQQIDAHLDLMPGGPVPPNPSELLGSERMRNFLARMREQYDYVFIDTTPPLAVTDPVVLAKSVDAVLLVARVRRVEDHQIAESVERLERSGTPVSGIIANAVQPTGADSKYGYGYGYGYGERREQQAAVGGGAAAGGGAGVGGGAGAGSSPVSKEPGHRA